MNWRLACRRTALHRRAAVVQGIRSHFIKEGFLEVETPLRIPAPAPESHIDAIPSLDWFLHTSPELCMKRLLAAGYERIFQICRCWRHGERGTKHIPEFTMLEWYRANSAYDALMADCEQLLTSLAPSLTVRFRGISVPLTPPWERIAIREAFSRFTATTMEDALASDRFDEVMVQDIEPKLGLDSPTFLFDYPAERSALARLNGADPTLAERFELYIGGVELANGFSELTDPEEQRQRFAQEEQFRRAAGRTPYPVAERFLEELSAMPPSAGIALGVDRLAMVMLDAAEIDEVVAFTPEEL